MANEHRPTYRFLTAHFPEDTFHVIKFRGTEGLSQCYEFQIQLATKNFDLDPAEIMDKTARFSIVREQGSEVFFNGILAKIKELGSAKGLVFYEVRLVPRLWWLNNTHHNQVFLNMTVPQIIEGVLVDGGLTSQDFEFRLTREYPIRKYTCQHRESHFNFFSRWLEHQGMYYFFEQDPSGEKIIITDAKLAHQELEPGTQVLFSPPSGLASVHIEEIIHQFSLHQQLAPRKVLLKDYNDQKPDLDLSSELEIAPRGLGEFYYYAENYETPEEGRTLAGIRAEELKCQTRQFHGAGSVPFLRPGYLFRLQDHYRESFNQTYLVLQMEHAGHQTSYLVDGLGFQLSAREKSPLYRNQFTAIAAETQFRPTRQAQMPRFYGVISAHVDAAGSGQYAELDEQGRYKVILPFDLSGRKDGKASTWLRMAQPYTGAGHGLHFPLHKGTEVLLTFLDGDPDRPIINAAGPNLDQPSMVTSANQTRAGFKTAGGSHFYAEDLDGKQQMVMKPGDGNTVLRAGSGSGSSIDCVSQGFNSAVTMYSAYCSGLGSDTVCVKNITEITGLWTAVVISFVEKIIKDKAPDLLTKLITGQSADDKDAKESTKNIELWIEGLSELVISYCKGKYLAKVEATILQNADPSTSKLGKTDPAFMVLSQGKQTLVVNEGSGEDIVLATDKGKVKVFGQEEVNLVSAHDVNIIGKDTKVCSSVGTIDLKGSQIQVVGAYDRFAPVDPSSKLTIDKGGNVKLVQGREAATTELQSKNTINLKVGDNSQIELNQQGCRTTVGEKIVNVTAKSIKLSGSDAAVTVMDNLISMAPAPNNSLALQKDMLSINFPTVNFNAKQVVYRCDQKVVFL